MQISKVMGVMGGSLRCVSPYKKEGAGCRLKAVFHPLPDWAVVRMEPNVHHTLSDHSILPIVWKPSEVSALEIRKLRQRECKTPICETIAG